MSQHRIFNGAVFFIVTVTMLVACETEKIQQTEFSIQQNLFLQSLELVESAGVNLQKPGLTPTDIENAMNQMDEGLKRAFQVNTRFLKKLDVRLPRLYTEIFISGVENYRLGVESSDRQKQLDGLNRLSQWGKFWREEKSNIMQKLVRMNG